MISEFREFLSKTNALALAIGVVIGVAVGKVVSAISDDLIMPIVGLILPGGNWREAKYVLSRTVDASGKVSENAILYGHFLGTLIDFLIVALVVFFIARALIKDAPAGE